MGRCRTKPDLCSFSLNIGNQLRNRLSAFMFNVSSTVFERLQELDTFAGITQWRAGRVKTHSQRREHLRNTPHTNDCTVFMWRINTVARKGSTVHSGRNTASTYLGEFHKTCQELIYYCYYLLIHFFSKSKEQKMFIIWLFHSNYTQSK